MGRSVITDRCYATAALNASTPNSKDFAAALSVLAGVKIRKARAFCGLDANATCSHGAEKRLAEARDRWRGRVLGVDHDTIRSAVYRFGHVWTVDHGLQEVERSLPLPQVVICERSAPSAQGFLAARVSQQPYKLIPGRELDPGALIEGVPWRAMFVVYVGPGTSDDLLLWTAMLGRACRGSLLGVPDAVCAVVHPSRLGAAMKAFGGWQQLVR